MLANSRIGINAENLRTHVKYTTRFYEQAMNKRGNVDGVVIIPDRHSVTSLEDSDPRVDAPLHKYVEVVGHVRQRPVHAHDLGIRPAGYTRQ